MLKKLFLIAVLLFIPLSIYSEPIHPSSKIGGSSYWEITWDDGAANTQNIAPDTDTGMNIFRATTTHIWCGVLTTDDIGGTGNLSTSIDVDVLSSSDCINYDAPTTPYAPNFIKIDADNVATSYGLTTGARCIKLRADNDDAVNTMDLTCRIISSWD